MKIIDSIKNDINHVKTTKGVWSIRKRNIFIKWGTVVAAVLLIVVVVLCSILIRPNAGKKNTNNNNNKYVVQQQPTKKETPKPTQAPTIPSPKPEATTKPVEENDLNNSTEEETVYEEPTDVYVAENTSTIAKEENRPVDISELERIDILPEDANPFMTKEEERDDIGIDRVVDEQIVVNIPSPEETIPDNTNNEAGEVIVVVPEVPEPTVTKITFDDDPYAGENVEKETIAPQKPIVTTPQRPVETAPQKPTATTPQRPAETTPQKPVQTLTPPKTTETETKPEKISVDFVKAEGAGVINACIAPSGQGHTVRGYWIYADGSSKAASSTTNGYKKIYKFGIDKKAVGLKVTVDNEEFYYDL